MRRKTISTKNLNKLSAEALKAHDRQKSSLLMRWRRLEKKTRKLLWTWSSTPRTTWSRQMIGCCTRLTWFWMSWPPRSPSNHKVSTICCSVSVLAKFISTRWFTFTRRCLVRRSKKKGCWGRLDAWSTPIIIHRTIVWIRIARYRGLGAQSTRIRARFRQLRSHSWGSSPFRC